MKWINDNEVEEIKNRAIAQSFPERTTDIYEWYSRYMSLTLALLMAIPLAIERTPKWACMLIIWLIIAYHQNKSWNSYKERYVLKLMLTKEKNNEKAEQAL
jgi:hypothetical protein